MGFVKFNILVDDQKMVRYVDPNDISSFTNHVASWSESGGHRSKKYPNSSILLKSGVSVTVQETPEEVMTILKEFFIDNSIRREL